MTVSLQQSMLQTENLLAFAAADYRGEAPEPVGDPDDLLMELAGRGDVVAFGKLVERYSEWLYRVAIRLLCDAGEAEDAVQDCFTRLWQNAPLWEIRGGGLLTWLRRVTVNICLDRLRRFRVVSDGELPEIEDESPRPERRLAMSALDQLIERRIQCNHFPVHRPGAKRFLALARVHLTESLPSRQRALALIRAIAILGTGQKG